MCLTARWVDDSWKLRKKILNFCRISNHKGVTIGNLVYHCLQEWGITRVFTVTVDNASSNDGAIRRLRTLLKGPNAILDCKYIHLRCCAHIINLVVRDGLEEQISSICKIRNAVKYLRSSSGRQESFENGVEIEKVDCKRKSCLDVDTRESVAYVLLYYSMFFYTNKVAYVVFRLELNERDYTSYFDNVTEDGEEGTRMIPKTKKKKKNVVGVPNEDDWSNASEDDCSMKIDLDDGFSKYLETQYGEGDDYTEVDVYLKDGAEKRGDNSIDVLGWWNQNMTKFLIPSQVAKHVLAMPISTVASESAFSTGGRVIDKYRSSLTPKTTEALICVQDWLRSTPADLQDMPINGLPLEEMVENLEKLEL
ncbi:putative transposase, partial [Tanacetum coccineum]